MLPRRRAAAEVGPARGPSAGWAGSNLLAVLALQRELDWLVVLRADAVEHTDDGVVVQAVRDHVEVQHPWRPTSGANGNDRRKDCSLERLRPARALELLGGEVPVARGHEWRPVAIENAADAGEELPIHV
eukprot:4161215-Pyramimonas_sp.AAC.1